MFITKHSRNSSYYNDIQSQAGTLNVSMKEYGLSCASSPRQQTSLDGR